MSHSSVSVRCDDCGATHALADGQEGSALLAELHLFLQQHEECSYSVSVNLATGENPAQRGTGS